MRPLACLLLALLGAGCAEMRQAPQAGAPATLVGGAADPLRASIAAMAPAFADQARGLAGHPAAAAQAAAQLEYVTAALPRSRNYAGFPEQVWRGLVLARQEMRDALGVADDALPENVIPALLSAASALRGDDPARAALALPAPMFRPGGERSVARLGESGPLPQGAIATGLAQQEMARLDTEGRWVAGRAVDATGSDLLGPGYGASSLGY